MIEEINENEFLEEIKAACPEENEEKDGVEEVDAKELKLELKPLDRSHVDGEIFEATCHTWFIVKDSEMEINWRKPLVQKGQVSSQVKIASQPFAEGAMRYAFYMQDLASKNEYVAKLPKDLRPKTYNLEEMKNDIEAMFVCSHIVNEFNEKLISSIDSKYLVEFVHAFVYEILDEASPYKYYYGENFINGKYEKYNNNAGWKAGRDS